MSREIQDPDVREGRELGRSMADRGAFELDTSSGRIEWANDFALAVVECSAEQLQSLSVFDLTPERFHERIREDLAGEPEEGESRRFYILPTNTVGGKVAWWYVFKTVASGSRRWSYAEHIQNTPQSGPEFAFMSMQSDVLENQAELVERMDDLEKWVQGQIRRVDGDVGFLQGQMAELRAGLEKAEAAALKAAAESIGAKNAALATQQELKKYATKAEMGAHFEKFDKFDEASTKASSEILRLIRSDGEQKERARAYEEHVKKTTESAIKIIESQASKSGQGLSRKVTVPFFVITTLAMVIQYVIQHFHLLP